MDENNLTRWKLQVGGRFSILTPKNGSRGLPFRLDAPLYSTHGMTISSILLNIHTHAIIVTFMLLCEGWFTEASHNQGICAHVDLMRFEDGIAIVSLESSCVMHLSRVETEACSTGGEANYVKPFVKINYTLVNCCVR